MCIGTEKKIAWGVVRRELEEGLYYRGSGGRRSLKESGGRPGLKKACIVHRIWLE